jgi:hypothetical protein
MKSKQLALLILLAGALGAAVWYLNKESKQTSGDSAIAAGGKVVAFPVEKVAQLTIHSSEGTVNLTQKGDAWSVQERGDYPADFERLGNLLRKVWDLKTVQEVKVGPSQFARFDLTDPAQTGGTATRVDFKDKDGKPLAALLVGKKFMKKSDGPSGPFGDEGGFPAGRYVMPSGGTKVSLISDTLDDVDPKPASWLRHDFFKIESPSGVTLDGATDAQKWKLTRATASAEWKLAGAKDAEKVDQAKVSQVASAFAFAAFADVLNPDAKPADTGLDKPVTATFTTFDGFSYVLKIGKEKDGNQPVTVAVSAQFAKERTPTKDEKPEDKTKLDEEFKAKIKKFEEKLAAEKKFEGRPFLIAKSSIDSIVKERAALLEEKKPDPAPGAGSLPPGATPFPPGAGPLPPGFPPAPPVPGAPGANVPPPPPPPKPPVTVTTPPVAVPPMPKEPPKAPAKPEPISATTPPLPVPPPAGPTKKPEIPKAPEKPDAPATPQTPPPPAPPAPPVPPPAPQPPPAK